MLLRTLVHGKFDYGVLVKIEITNIHEPAFKLLSQLTPAFYSQCGESMRVPRIPEFPQVSLRETDQVGQDTFNAFGKLYYEVEPVDKVIEVRYNSWYMYEKNAAISQYGEPSKWRLDRPQVEVLDTGPILDSCTLVAGVTQYNPYQAKRIRIEPKSSFHSKECTRRVSRRRRSAEWLSVNQNESILDRMRQLYPSSGTTSSSDPTWLPSKQPNSELSSADDTLSPRSPSATKVAE